MKGKTISSTIMALALTYMIVGCSSKPTYTRVINSRPFDYQGAEQAKKYFQYGKDYYFNFKFSESIEYLRKALWYGHSNRKKATYYLYIGANYFYLDDINSSISSFSKAKELDRYNTPSRSEFPNEIINLYYRSP